MVTVFLNGKRLAPGAYMLYEDEVWTPEDEEEYSNPDNHLPPVETVSDCL